MSEKFNSAEMTTAKGYLDDMAKKMKEAANALAEIDTSTIGVMAIKELQQIVNENTTNVNEAEKVAESASNTIRAKIKALG